MTDSLELFKNITHLQYFQQTSVILFLNKIDIFEEKLKFIPLKNAFPEYAGLFLSISQDFVQK